MCDHEVCNREADPDKPLTGDEVNSILECLEESGLVNRVVDPFEDKNYWYATKEKP